ncbi:hypothetical protein ACSLOY_28635, partial [Klebsiella pneumoniae]
LHRLIKAGELSTCRGERNAKMLDTSELLRVFGAFAPVPVEQREALNQRESILQKKELALETTLEKARKYVAGERHNTELAR